MTHITLARTLPCKTIDRIVGAFDIFWREYVASRKLDTKLEIQRAEHWRSGNFWNPPIEWVSEWQESRRTKNDALIRYFLCSQYWSWDGAIDERVRNFVGPWAVIRFQTISNDRQRVCLDIISLDTETPLHSSKPISSKQELEEIFSSFITYLYNEEIIDQQKKPDWGTPDVINLVKPLNWYHTEKRFNTTSEAFIKVLEQYCLSQYAPDWGEISIKPIRFRDIHPTHKEDAVLGIFFHKCEPINGQLLAIPDLDPSENLQVIIGLSEVGGACPLSIKHYPCTEDGLVFFTKFLKSDQEGWSCPENTVHHVEEMHRDLEEGIDDLKRRQVAIYHRVGSAERAVVDAVLGQIKQQRIEQGEQQRILDAVRRTLKHIQSVDLSFMDEEVKQSLADISRKLDSDLSFSQKLELTIPIVPYFLEYKVELGAGVDVDLNSVWEELKERAERFQKGKNDTEASGP